MNNHIGNIYNDNKNKSLSKNRKYYNGYNTQTICALNFGGCNENTGNCGIFAGGCKINNKNCWVDGGFG